MTAQSPWKPCDLRGVYPSEVSEDLFHRVGGAVGTEIAEGSSVVVGGDFRLSSGVLKSALIDGLVSAGLHVIDAGHVPTPVVYFEASRVGAAAVFIVTASHNPASCNGLKWMTGSLPPAPSDMDRVREAVDSGRHRKGCGSLEYSDPVPAYLEWIVSRWRWLPVHRTGPLILDAGNGAWSLLAPKVLRELGFDITCLHGDPDGRFPNRSPDCARTSSLTALRAAVMERPGAMGIAWDGDGDRVAFVDENGVHASTDEVSILFARHVLGGARVPQNIVCDIKLSDGVRREVLAAGGVPLIERSGHTFMRSRLLTNNAILGLDACGHFFFREAGSRDDGLYSALYMLGILNGERTLGELREALLPMFSTPELRLPASVLDFPVVRERLRAAFPGAEESHIDGIRLALQEGVVLARESSTEPVVSLRIEGHSAGTRDQLIALCLECLHEAHVLLSEQISLPQLGFTGE
jgi:phosphomannomutase/phosphoglucomutase